MNMDFTSAAKQSANLKQTLGSLTPGDLTKQLSQTSKESQLKGAEYSSRIAAALSKNTSNIVKATGPGLLESATLGAGRNESGDSKSKKDRMNGGKSEDKKSSSSSSSSSKSSSSKSSSSSDSDKMKRQTNNTN
jgi:hypothetical protein